MNLMFDDMNIIVLESVKSSQWYSHVLPLLLDGTTRSSERGFLMMSCQWMVSAWHKNLFWSTYTPPFRISGTQY